MTVAAKRYIAYRFVTGEMLVVDVDEDLQWLGGTEAQYDTYQECFDKWIIAARHKERPLPSEFAHRALAGTKLISFIARPR